jgi:cyclase
MNRKRLIGVVTVKDSWAVQSFGYRRYLPLGRPEILVENLDRWGADEILVQCIDRSPRGLGPDFALLERIGRLGLATPLIYAGGIRSVDDARRVIQGGADRIGLDALLHDAIAVVDELAQCFGAQALIAHLPLWLDRSGALRWRDYRRGTVAPLPEVLLGRLRDGLLSEALVIDVLHEGHAGAFDERLLQAFPLRETPLIAFGGLSEAAQMQRTLALDHVAAVAVGNFLSYREHAVQNYKQQLAGAPIRLAHYAGGDDYE